MQEEKDTELAELLLELRQARGLSVKRLAALSGVSRKTIDNAEAGLNISVFVLKRLLRPLGVEEITLRVQGAHAAGAAEGLAQADARAIFDAVRKASALLQTATQRLDGSARRPAGDVSHRAERLIASFSTFVRGVDDAGELDRLQDSVTSLCAAERRAPRKRAASRRRSG
jgi:transcriptional regulator with XRE-family HTH domain